MLPLFSLLIVVTISSTVTVYRQQTVLHVSTSAILFTCAVYVKLVVEQPVKHKQHI